MAARGSTMSAISRPGFWKTCRAGNRAAIDAGIAGGRLKVINLPHRIPVAWVYVTGWVTRDGTVNFREDVYKHMSDILDPDALADVVAGSTPDSVSQNSNLDSR